MSPGAIEDVLAAHPHVREAAVTGAPDPLEGEVAVAFVALRDGAPRDPEALRRSCRAALPSHMVPRRVVFVAALPRNEAGKVLRRELRPPGGEDVLERRAALRS